MNVPQPPTDTKTKEMLRDANANILFHTRNKSAATWDQAQTEKELDLFYRQLEALDSPTAEHLRIDEKKALREYYKNKIRQGAQRLDIFIHGVALTERARNCNVEFEVVA